MKKVLLTSFLTIIAVAVLAPAAFAANGESPAETLMGFAAALGLGIAAAGGAIGQGRTASAALEGIARNPGASDKIFTPMILGLALIESLVIYALLIAFIYNKG
ncbi:MAG: ATP synthase F0 subunit C [Myxococcales bacterium]|nr:ATP synthase F0 subunit C [Myxococcales bacterium]MCB9731424.1 ATP synthase F0 subunit C [Deltaproteobacteria bacterium]